LVESDALTWEPKQQFDAILLDAPCSATGTFRRHPEVFYRARPRIIAENAELQARLLARAADFLKPGGALVYAVCSLEPEEGEQQIGALLARNSAVRRRPVSEGEVPGIAEFLNTQGDLRTLPSAWPDSDPRMVGLDGFFAASLERI